MNKSNHATSSDARRPGRPPVNFAARRDEIVRMVTKLFAERGFHGTSITDICEASNIGKGVLYHYVESKEDLLFIIHERFIEPFLERARGLLVEGGSPDAALVNLSAELMTTVADHQDEVTVFLHEWKMLRRNEAKWKKVKQKRRELERIVEDTIRAGQKSGLFRDIDPRATALAFLGMHNYAYQWLNAHGRLRPTEIATIFADIFLNGLMSSDREDDEESDLAPFSVHS